LNRRGLPPRLNELARPELPSEIRLVKIRSKKDEPNVCRTLRTQLGGKSGDELHATVGPLIAVQLLDVAWSFFVLRGIEKVRIVPGITAANPLDLYYMPYTHSLVGAALWSTAAGIAYYVLRKADGWSTAAFVGIAVFSHWVLDWLVHRPDLPLYRQFFQGRSRTLALSGASL
jgi:hypothetical protein